MTDGEEDKRRDRLSPDYGSVLRENAILTTFSVFLFGFLLNIAVNPAKSLIFIDKIILLIALFSITISAVLFIMPVIYHHLEYPYIDFDKFKERTHRFTLFGMIPAMVTLFLGLQIATRSLIGDITASFAFGTIPFILIYIFYRLRK